MEILLAIDRSLFITINHLPHTFISDNLALFFSGVGSAGFVWIGIGLFLFLKEEKKNHKFFVPILAALGLCWLLVEGVLKFLVARPRPGVLDNAIVVGSAGWFSFPSSHAATSWAMAVILARYEPRLTWVFYLLASVISFTRIYLGVHFPLDVLVGSFIGWGIGMVALAVSGGNKQAPKRKHIHATRVTSKR